MIWFFYAVIFVTTWVWGFEPGRSSEQNTAIGVVCFLVAAGAGSFAVSSADAVGWAIAGVVMAAGAGILGGIAVRRWSARSRTGG